MLPQTACDPYETLLRAGEIRAQAAALEHEAVTLEGLARMALQAEKVPLNITAQHPNTVLCLAYSGPANGHLTRVPYESMQQLKLVADGTSPGGLALVQLHDYEPAMIIKVGDYVVGALVLPKGGVAQLFAELRAPKPADGYRPVSVAIAKMLTLAVGFNADMVQNIVASSEHGAHGFDDAPSTPLFVQLAPSA